MKNKDIYNLAKKISSTRPSRKNLMFGFIFASVIVMLVMWLLGAIIPEYNRHYSDKSMLECKLVASENGYHKRYNDTQRKTGWGFAFNDTQKESILKDKNFVRTFTTSSLPSKINIKNISQNTAAAFSDSLAVRIVDYTNADKNFKKETIYPKGNEIIISYDYSVNGKVAIGDFISVEAYYKTNLSEIKYAVSVAKENLSFGMLEDVFEASIPLLNNFKVIGIQPETQGQVCDIVLSSDAFDLKYMPKSMNIGENVLYYYENDCMQLATECVKQGKYFPFLLNSKTSTAWTVEDMCSSGVMWEYQFFAENINEIKSYRKFLKSTMANLQFDSNYVTMVDSSAFSNNYRSISDMETIFYTIIMFLMVIGLVVLIFVLLNFYTTFNFMLQSEKKFYNMLKIIGIDDKDFKKVLYAESAIIICKSMLISVIITCTLSVAFYILFNKFIYTKKLFAKTV